MIRIQFTLTCVLIDVYERLLSGAEERLWRKRSADDLYTKGILDELQAPFVEERVLLLRFADVQVIDGDFDEISDTQVCKRYEDDPGLDMETLPFRP